MAAKKKIKDMNNYELDGELTNVRVAMANQDEYCCMDGKNRDGDVLGSYHDNLLDALDSGNSVGDADVTNPKPNKPSGLATGKLKNKSTVKKIPY